MGGHECGVAAGDTRITTEALASLLSLTSVICIFSLTAHRSLVLGEGGEWERKREESGRYIYIYIYIERERERKRERERFATMGMMEAMHDVVDQQSFEECTQTFPNPSIPHVPLTPFLFAPSPLVFGFILYSISISLFISLSISVCLDSFHPY